MWVRDIINSRTKAVTILRVLPPLGNVPVASDAITTYLGRQRGWKPLRDLLSARGERAVPYSFRHP